MHFHNFMHLTENYFMQKILKPIIIALSLGFFIVMLAAKKPAQPSVTTKTASKIQVAILLDVSSSMDGLIEQAKAQLWNMVSVMGKAKCNDVAPNVEIALYEYGRDGNDAKQGYVKQINGFINDLDSLSENLFKLTTNGGDEYCGQVIYTSLHDLKWDAAPENYKVIFIAGNEDFLQGSLQYNVACSKAKEKGVVVNTIYCGDKAQGIKEHWNLGAECGNGSFTNINTNAKIEDIPTPYDSMMISLNGSLNTTYVSYGYGAANGFAKQAKMDEVNIQVNKSVGIKRAAAKAQKNVYRNNDWDLVDAYEADSTAITRVDKKTLPDSLKNKTTAQIKAMVLEQQNKRNAIQNEIQSLNTKREAYLVEERKRRAATTNEPTLETEVEKIIKQQAKRYNIKID
jgi:hypothetical protein